MKLPLLKLSCALLFAAALTKAAVAQSLGLAPAQIVADFKPGVPFEYSLTVQNNDSRPVELHVQVTDFWYTDKNEKLFGAPGTSPRSAANWIQFVPEKFQVAGGASQKMRAIVTPPTDASGGYYAVLFVESKPVSSDKVTEDGRRMFTNMRIGCLVLLTAKGTENYKLNLDQIKLTPPTDNHGLKLTFTLDNQSNTHVFPQARLAILSPDRKLAGKAESPVKRFLPGQKDTMQVDWNGELGPGEYTAVLSLIYSGNQVETRQIGFTVPAKTASR